MIDKFIKNIVNRLMAKQQPEGKPYYMEGKLLKKYIFDNKQRFEVTVVAPKLCPLIIKFGT